MGAKIKQLFLATKFGDRTGKERSRSEAEAETSLVNEWNVNIFAQQKYTENASKNDEYTPKMRNVK